MDIESLFPDLNEKPIELQPRAAGERHFVVRDPADLLKISTWLQTMAACLVTLTASDERLREERAFKLHYLFSASCTDEFIIIEFQLKDTREPIYPSLRNNFPYLAPLEAAIYDMFGLASDAVPTEAWGDFLLHRSAYSCESPLRPLRRTRSRSRLAQILSTHRPPAPLSRAWQADSILWVGPVHADLIESGQYIFLVSGEIIQQLSLRLGYKHRGIEKLFETSYTLEDGWKLAEQVVGDSAFAHSLAYCQAVESIAHISLPPAALAWRGLFLELERIHNHIADVSALAHDVAYQRIAAPLSTLRETMLQLNDRLGGSRLLRGINRPGGVCLPATSGDLCKTGQLLDAVNDEFLDLAQDLMENPRCRERMLKTGLLSSQAAEKATGLVRRASGDFTHDFRLLHPRCPYDDPAVQEILRATITPESEEYPARHLPVYPHDLVGDVFARLALRVAEVESSTQLCAYFIRQLLNMDPQIPTTIAISTALSAAANLDLGLGYVEGWRGDVVYSLLKGPNNTIFRCQPRDPSVFNWNVFPQSVQGNRLADFPLINKSFNLSYAGYDL